MKTTKTPQTERAAKLHLAKMHKAYEAAQTVIWAVQEEGRAGGWPEELFARMTAARADKSARLDAMYAFRDECKTRGWYVTNSTLRYLESATYQLVCENRD